MEEIIEGCFKLFFGLFFLLGIPVLMLYGVWLGLRWLWQQLVLLVIELHELWSQYGMYVLGTIAALVALFVGGWLVSLWWQAYRIKRIRRRALKRLDALYERTAKKIDGLGTTPDGTP